MTLRDSAIRIVKKGLKVSNPWPEHKIVYTNVVIQPNYGSRVELTLVDKTGKRQGIAIGFCDIIFSHEFALSIWPEDKALQNLALLSAQSTDKGRINFIKSTL